MHNRLWGRSLLVPIGELAGTYRMGARELPPPKGETDDPETRDEIESPEPGSRGHRDLLQPGVRLVVDGPALHLPHPPHHDRQPLHGAHRQLAHDNVMKEKTADKHKTLNRELYELE